MNHSRAALIAIAVIIPLAMVATAYTGKTTQATNNVNAQDKIRVVTSFYPLYEFTQQVAGEKADVINIIPSGIEPHDWEPTSNDIVRIQSANLLVINGAGFESWADDIDVKLIVDTSKGIELLEGGDEEDAGHEEEEEHGATDPHIWLDPILAKQQVANIRDALVQMDPANTDYYNLNANQYLAELDSLDKFVVTEFSTCEKKDFIAFHSAFSYFAERYGLTQHSIHGVSPEGEILPQKIREVIELAGNLGIDVIYSEELVDPRLADVIASEIQGGKVMTLSPIEGLESQEIENDIGYIDKMKQNVINLKEGLNCAR